jgi:apolipoprotein N-acyltransferase
MYVKQHPVPFGEYLPGRALLQRLVGRFADDLPNDFLPGHTPGRLALAGPAGTYGIGDVICFEVAYDGLVRDTVDSHTRLLVVQTNNATFGRTGETYQQLAMSRLRSIEHGRSTAVVATSGMSALITPDGTVLQRSSLYAPAVLEAALPLRTTRTIADRVGAAPEYVLVGVALCGLGIAMWRRRDPADRRRHRATGRRPAGHVATGTEAGSTP